MGTEAGRRATKKYLKKLSAYTLRMTVDEMERYKMEAEKRGMSFRAFILKSMDRFIKRSGEHEKNNQGQEI